MEQQFTGYDKPLAWHFKWFYKKDNKEEIIEGKKVWMNENRRAKMYIKQCQDDKYFPFEIKRSFISDSFDGGVMVTIEGINWKDTRKLRV